MTIERALDRVGELSELLCPIAVEGVAKNHKEKIRAARSLVHDTLQLAR